MSSIIPFDFEGAAVRTLSRDGEPWFVLADVCRVLGLTDPSNASRMLDPDEKGPCKIQTPGGVQTLITINEAGLWRLVLRSDKPEAKRFQKHLVAVILPAIRRTGGYIPVAAEDTPDVIMAKALLLADATIKDQASRLAIAQPKADALDRIADLTGSITVTEAAKALQVAPRDLTKWLMDHRWAYRRTPRSELLGRQASGAGLGGGGGARTSRGLLSGPSASHSAPENDLITLWRPSLGARRVTRFQLHVPSPAATERPGGLHGLRH